MDTLTWQQILAPIVLIILALLVFWQVVVRPTQTRQQKHQELVKTISVGDRVITAGGIYGRILNLGEKTVGLEIAKGITVTFDRRAIRRLQGEEDL
jgi:preprotein translocase subunit YajC